MGAGAASGISVAAESASKGELQALVSGVTPEDRARLLEILSTPGVDAKSDMECTLYIREKCMNSMRVLVFLLESGLLNKVEVLGEDKLPKTVVDDVLAQFGEKIQVLKDSGETWLPALKHTGGYEIDDDKIIEMLAKAHGIALDTCKCLHIYNMGVAKDFKIMQQELKYLAMVVFLTQSCPEFVDGWRLRMILGTICDEYDSIIDSADKIVSLKPGDPQALTLKAFYCQALKRDGYSEAMSALTQSAPKIADMASKLVIGVDKYWDAELTHTVPSGISEKMAILALGSPADDDGTPRPRLLGTLQKTLEAANMYPDADIFVTGAAVAIAMKNWLQKRGVSNNIIMEMKAMDTVGNYEYIAPILQERQVSKVMLITVYYHLNRSSALADAVFEAKNVNVEVVGVAGESDLKGDALAAQMSVERPASYRDVARARGLYDAISFDQIVA